MTMKKNNRAWIMVPIIAVVSILVLAGCTNNARTAQDNGDSSSLSQKKVTIYKLATCGCCVAYAAELEKQGFKVQTPTTNQFEMTAVKDKYDIPINMQSCHTAIIDGYFVEGHVPFEAVNKLLAEKPDIDGIALPGMPAGSPGMPGRKTASFIVYAISNGSSSEYVTI